MRYKVERVDANDKRRIVLRYWTGFTKGGKDVKPSVTKTWQCDSFALPNGLSRNGIRLRKQHLRLWCNGGEPLGYRVNAYGKYPRCPMRSGSRRGTRFTAHLNRVYSLRKVSGIRDRGHERVNLRLR